MWKAQCELGPCDRREAEGLTVNLEPEISMDGVILVQEVELEGILNLSQEEKQAAGEGVWVREL